MAKHNAPDMLHCVDKSAAARTRTDVVVDRNALHIVKRAGR
jgi:hypothetical protein